jgi:hypothetical protein
VVDSYDWERCKKNAPGAFEGFVLSGSSAGKTVWARQDHYDERDHKPAVTAAADLKEPTPKEKAQALSHNRQVLDNRRTALALQSLADHLRGVHNLAALAACLDLKSAAALGLLFGWDQKCKAEAEWSGDGLAKLLARREADVSPKDLFIVVLDPMVQRLFVMKTTEANDRQVAHAEFYCELFNLDWKGFLAKAAEEIKEPKAWAALEAPGPTAVEQLAERAGKSRTEKTKQPEAKGKGKKARPGLQLQDKAPAERPIEDLVNEDLKKLEPKMFPKKKAKGKAKPKAAGKKGGGK